MPPKQVSSRNLTNKEKLKICQKHDELPRLTQAALCAWAKQEFNLPKPPTQSTISSILKKRREYEAMDSTSLEAKVDIFGSLLFYTNDC